MNLGFLIAFGLVATTFIGWGVVGNWDATDYSVSQHTPGCDATDGAFNTLDLTGMNSSDQSAGFHTRYTCDETDPNICWRSESDFDTGDIAWMLCATTFVMLQTPAAGFAQGGLVRRKNAMSVIGQAFIGVVIGCILWFVIGYSLVFGPSCGDGGCTDAATGFSVNGFIGDITAHAFFKDVDASKCTGTIPVLLFATFQMTFALMVPVLITGAWAEKFKLSSAVIFMIIWPILVYYPSAHWVWGSGFMAAGSWNGDVGVLDYAGGIVIHTSSGVSAFVVAMMLQKRADFKKPDTTHNLPLTMVGVALIWVGWFSFNGGSGLRANGQAIGALLVTQISSCFAAMTWGLLSYREDGRVQITHIASGALCGLAGITPGSGFVLPIAGVPIGILTGLAGWYGGYLVTSQVKLDDVLDVTSLQAFPGALGSILVGFFATTDAHGCQVPTFPGRECGRGSNKNMGIFYGGNGELLGYQIAAVLTMIAWAAVMTWVTMKIIAMTTGLNVTAEDEELGLDLAYHGEKAYDLEDDDDLEDMAKVVKLINAAQSGDKAEVVKVITRFGVDPSKVDVDGRTGLHLAAKFGKTEICKLFIEGYKVSPNVSDLKGSTPLREARQGGHGKTANYLEEKGGIAEFQVTDATRMLGAAARGDIGLLHQYLSGGVDANEVDYDQRSALHLAASEGRMDVVKLLLDKGARPSLPDRWGFKAVDDAIRHKHGDIAELIKSFVNGGRTSVDLDVVIPLTESKSRVSITEASVMGLLIAGKAGDIAELKRLQKKNANMFAADYDGRTALHQACQAGQLGAVRFLVALKNVDVNVKDHDGFTPMADAVENGHLEVATLLKDNGGVLGLQDGALCILAAKGKTIEIERLIKAGVDVNTSDYDKRSPLHLAASTGQEKVVKMLLANSANVNALDRNNGTPLDDAKSGQHAAIIELLVAAGGTSDTSRSSYRKTVVPEQEGGMMTTMI
jgi:Amt family ammonium transporter